MIIKEIKKLKSGNTLYLCSCDNVNCKKEFERRIKNIESRTFCSIKCSYTEERKKQVKELMAGNKYGKFLKGIKFTDDHKKKIGDAQRGNKNHRFGKEVSDKTRKLLSEAGKGRASWNKGLKMPKEFGQKISSALKGLKKGDKCYFWKGGISSEPYPP